MLTSYGVLSLAKTTEDQRMAKMNYEQNLRSSPSLVLSQIYPSDSSIVSYTLQQVSHPPKR